MKFAAIGLIVLGIVALIYGGFTYKHEKTVLDLGPIQATATEHKTIPIPPIVGAIALVGGLAMLVLPRRAA